MKLTATGADVLAGMCRRRRLEISRREAGMDEQWTFEVQSVTRIEPAPGEVDEVPFYAVVFDVAGPDANAEVEIFVTDVPDPAAIIALAMATLHTAFAAWARVTLGRRIANDDGAPSQG